MGIAQESHGSRFNSKGRDHIVCEILFAIFSRLGRRLRSHPRNPLELTLSWQGLKMSRRMILHVLYDQAARCLLVLQGCSIMCVSGQDGVTFQESPKSVARVSGSFCGVRKSSFWFSFRLPHRPHGLPANLRK